MAEEGAPSRDSTLPETLSLFRITHAVVRSISLICEHGYHRQQVPGSMQGVHAVSFNLQTLAGRGGGIGEQAPCTLSQGS